MKYVPWENTNNETKRKGDKLGCLLTICKQKEDLIYNQSFSSGPSNSELRIEVFLKYSMQPLGKAKPVFL